MLFSSMGGGAYIYAFVALLPSRLGMLMKWAVRQSARSADAPPTFNFLATCPLRMAEEEDRVRIRRLATLRKRKERARDADRHCHVAAGCSEIETVRHGHAVAECSESERRERKRKSMAASRLNESPLRKSQRLRDRREYAQSKRNQGESSQQRYAGW